MLIVSRSSLGFWGAVEADVGAGLLAAGSGCFRWGKTVSSNSTSDEMTTLHLVLLSRGGNPLSLRRIPRMSVALLSGRVYVGDPCGCVDKPGIRIHGVG